MATIGVSLDKCSVPRRGKQQSLDYEELEYGMGIHNEPGSRRGVIEPLSEIVSNVIGMLTKEPLSKLERWYPQSQNQDLALMINNLGGLSKLELSVITEEVTRQLSTKGFNIRRIYAGTFVSSLDGPGFSVTLLGLNDEILPLLDAATTAPAWQSHNNNFVSIHDRIVPSKSTPITSSTRLSTNGKSSMHDIPVPIIKHILSAVEQSITEAEPAITRYDTLAGDGDCGETLLNGINGKYCCLSIGTAIS